MGASKQDRTPRKARQTSPTPLALRLDRCMGTMPSRNRSRVLSVVIRAPRCTVASPRRGAGTARPGPRRCGACGGRHAHAGRPVRPGFHSRIVLTGAAFNSGVVLVWRSQVIELSRLCGRDGAANTGFRDNCPFQDRILSRQQGLAVDAGTLRGARCDMMLPSSGLTQRSKRNGLLQPGAWFAGHGLSASTWQTALEHETTLIDGVPPDPQAAH